MLDDNYIKELVEKAAEFGGGKIHIIVNKAGYTWDGVIHKVYHTFRYPWQLAHWLMQFSNR